MFRALLDNMMVDAISASEFDTERYFAWFPMESKYEFGEYLQVCEECWINKFEDNMIYEYNKSRDFKETEMSNLERCVFAKFLNKNDNYKPGYYFIRVYSHLDSKENPRLSYDRQYIKVANGFNLLTMEPKYFNKGVIL